MKKYQVEFPDFGELGIALPENFTDISWAGDSCLAGPQFELLHADGEVFMTLFVDYLDKTKRNKNTPKDWKRFMLFDDADDLLYKSDDWEDMADWIMEHRREIL